MTVKAELVLHSKSAVTGRELVTFKIECPLVVWLDILTHRQLSRNASSSRAIPTAQWRKRVLDNPAIPLQIMRHEKGMSANVPLNDVVQEEIKRMWIDAVHSCAHIHELVSSMGASKQDANILLYQFAHVQAILSATNWKNFLNLRCDGEAKPDLQVLANLMRSQLLDSTPQILEFKQWHTPLILDLEEELSIEQKIKTSTARCARVSYFLPETGSVSHWSRDIELHDKLLISKHLSPFEHVATPSPIKDTICGNFIDWFQYRKLVESDEDCEIPQYPKYVTAKLAKEIVQL